MADSNLSNLEKFGFISGIVGLVADAIGLSTFIAELWGKSGRQAANAQSLFLALSVIALLYAWGVLSLTLASRALAQSDNPTFPGLMTVTAFAVGGTGLFTVPLLIAWLLAVSPPVAGEGQRNSPFFVGAMCGIPLIGFFCWFVVTLLLPLVCAGRSLKNSNSADE